MTRILQREVKPLGFTPETTYGTDAGGTRYAIPGYVKRATLKVDEHVESYIGVGGSFHTRRFFRKRRDVELTMTYQLVDDYNDSALASSFSSLFYGDAPESGGTISTAGVGGAGLLRPNTTNNNLRSATFECGYDTAATDVYYKVTGCVGKSYSIALKDGEPVDASATFVAQNVADQATAWVAAPALRTAQPFTSDDLTLTVTDPSAGSVTDLDVVDSTWKLENQLAIHGITQGTAARTIGQPQLVGRKVALELDLWRTGRQFEDIVTDADPATTASEWDITWSLSKNSAAEIYTVTLTDARVVSPWTVDVRDEDDVFKDKVTLEPESYTVDVI